MCPTAEQFSQNLHIKKIISNFLEYQILFEKFEAIPKRKWHVYGVCYMPINSTLALSLFSFFYFLWQRYRCNKEYYLPIDYQ